MKKLFTLFAAFAFTAITFAATETTVYYAVPSSVVSTYTVKLNVNQGETTDNWQQRDMVKQDYTYRTYDVYKCEFTDTEDGVKTMQFQLYDGETWKSQQAPIGAWTSVSYYNGEMYIHDKGWNSFDLRGAWDSWEGGIIFNENDKAVVNLAANTGYTFKVRNTKSNTWYGKDGDSQDIYPNNNSSSLSNTSGAEGYIVTSIAGEYTFEWDPISLSVTVTYPTTYNRSGLTAGAYGTLCLPVDGTVTGATLYNIAGKDASVLYLTENSNPTYATHGVPYIFKLGNSDTEISVALNNSYYTNTAETANGLHGVYTDQAFEDPFEVTNTYIVTNTEIQKASAGSGVHANRAYIELDEISGGAPSAPGRPIIAMPLGENGATSIDAIEASEKAVKFIENGKLFIQKNGVVYDMTGRIVK